MMTSFDDDDHKSAKSADIPAEEPTDDGQPSAAQGPSERPSRDSKGRWRKGHCPNPKGRPRKRREDPSLDGDMQHFMNKKITLKTPEGAQSMSRRAALNKKIFEEAMKGRPTAMRLLKQETKEADEMLAHALHIFFELGRRWVFDNPNYNKPGYVIPEAVVMRIEQARRILREYGFDV